MYIIIDNNYSVGNALIDEVRCQRKAAGQAKIQWQIVDPDVAKKSTSCFRTTASMWTWSTRRSARGPRRGRLGSTTAFS